MNQMNIQENIEAHAALSRAENTSNARPASRNGNNNLSKIKNSKTHN